MGQRGDWGEVQSPRSRGMTQGQTEFMGMVDGDKNQNCHQTFWLFPSLFTPSPHHTPFSSYCLFHQAFSVHISSLHKIGILFWLSDVADRLLVRYGGTGFRWTWVLVPVPALQGLPSALGTLLLGSDKSSESLFPC